MSWPSCWDFLHDGLSAEPLLANCLDPNDSSSVATSLVCLTRRPSSIWMQSDDWEAKCDTIEAMRSFLRSDSCTLITSAKVNMVGNHSHCCPHNHYYHYQHYYIANISNTLANFIVITTTAPRSTLPRLAIQSRHQKL